MIEHASQINKQSMTSVRARGSKKQDGSNKTLREEVGSIKLCQKPLWGQKGRERSPTSVATSRASAEEDGLGGAVKVGRVVWIQDPDGLVMWRKADVSIT